MTQDSFKKLFQQYGHVLDSTVMMDKDTGRPRGFGFVTFEDDEGVDRTLAMQPLMLDGKQIEVKRAQSRGQPASSAQPNRFSTPASESRGGQAPLRAWGSNSNSTASESAPASGGASGQFDPQAMAKMYQQMGWGSSAWNPQMMWQQMMSAYMGNAAKGSYGQGYGQSAQQGQQGQQGSQNQAAAAMAAYMRAYGGAQQGGEQGWGARGGAAASPPTDGRGRSGGTGSSQRERSPARNSRSYDERSRF